MLLFSINNLIFETLQDKAHPKLILLIIFNILVLLSTKEPLKCPIMNFLNMKGNFRGKRKIGEREREREREREVPDEEAQLSRRRSGGMDEQSWRRRKHRVQWHESAEEARGAGWGRFLF
ncbi:hypothetical protein AMTRI_Chr04g246600 [Amborella trichopoda]